jgi:hypothetical protein
MVKSRQPHLLKGVDLFLMEVVAIQHPRSPAQSRERSSMFAS